MRFLSLLTTLSLLAAPSVASAEEVAAILLLQGDVSVRDGGDERAVITGDVLERTDVVVVGEESAAILQLNNNYLVRIDEDLQVAVSDIVLLDAPPTDQPTKAQLDQLLYPEERETMQGIARAERVAGWHARVSAGSAAPPTLTGQARTTRSAVPVDGLTDGEDGDGGGDAVTETTELVERGRRLFPRRNRKPGAAATLAAPPAPPPPIEAEPEPLDLGSVRALVEAGDGQVCLQGWAETLPVELDAVELVLRAGADGLVERVILPQGFRPPACLIEILAGEAIPAAEVRLQVELP